MSRGNKVPLIEQVVGVYRSQFEAGHGVKKHDDKAAGLDKDRIYSYSTVRTYTRHACYFAAWAKEYPQAKADLGHKPRTLAECRPYADAWLTERIAAGLSPWTLKLEVAALAKLYGETAQDFRSTPARGRDAITRSRHDVATDRHFCVDRHRDIVDFGRSTGLRRRELSMVRGDALVYRDGRPYLHVTEGTKGGRERYAPIIGDPDRVARVVDMCRRAGHDRVWGKVPSGMDEHSYRAEYAAAIYNAHARDLETCKATPCYNPEHFNGKGRPKGGYDKDSVYRMRGAHAGEWLDKGAMLIASRALGHNRISVVGEHYLWSR